MADDNKTSRREVSQSASQIARPDAVREQSVSEEIAEMGRATVARGHTIVGHHPTRTELGVNVEGKVINRPIELTFGPGQEVELPLGEIARLRARGVLVGPGESIVVPGEGPSLIETGAVSAATRSLR